MHEVSLWFSNHKILINAPIEEKRLNCVPSPPWCIHILTVADFSSLATLTFKCFQDRHFTVWMKWDSFISLQTSLLRLVVGIGPCFVSDAAALDDSNCVLPE